MGEKLVGFVVGEDDIGARVVAADVVGTAVVMSFVVAATVVGACVVGAVVGTVVVASVTGTTVAETASPPSADVTDGHVPVSRLDMVLVMLFTSTARACSAEIYPDASVSAY